MTHRPGQKVLGFVLGQLETVLQLSTLPLRKAEWIVLNFFPRPGPAQQMMPEINGRDLGLLPPALHTQGCLI